MEKKVLDEIPLGRKNSSYSLSSKIVERNNKPLNGTVLGDDRGLPYLFLRMGKLNRASWTRYAIGVVAACSACFICRLHRIL
jgi:ATP-binding cassette subfamily B (MDR/TAP) protein 1